MQDRHELVAMLVEKKKLLQRKRQQLADRGTPTTFLDRLISATDRRKNQILHPGTDEHRPGPASQAV